ncbi:MAG: TIGR02281 family clan AA aspartic protease [Beijerinckiaceae bacterium]|jgi:aspartyl protease family protein|nr:TIGR02281 family clan AA aspartic protease [Beijerinckiaceae bacterium]MDO9439750.1 TIGR02281 family clan AA aspartic protease [Beijerinckiaceae bacterium]
MTFFLVLGLLGAALFALVASEPGEMILGMPPERFADLAFYGAIAVALIGTLAAQFRGQWWRGVQALAVWAMLLVGFATIYSYRFELAVVADRMMSELMPGRALVSKPGEATVVRRRDGHFIVDAQAGDARLAFIFDTGATSVVIRAEDATKIGVKLEGLVYDVPVSTANGRALAADARIPSLSIGGITERNVRALIARPGSLRENLLGQSFLERLASYTVENNRLMMRGRSQ